jgi:6-phosphogluconolactonase
LCYVIPKTGSTPKPIYEALAASKELDWSKISLFLVDERYVPADNHDSNTRMIRETMKNVSNIDTVLVAPNTALPLEQCIADYAARLQTLLDKSPLKSADVITFGLGDDGHTASLFPTLTDKDWEVVRKKETLVAHTTTTKFAGFDRITATYAIIAHATTKLFFLNGHGKFQVWNDMVRQSSDANASNRWPALPCLTTTSASSLPTVLIVNLPSSL